MLASHGEAGEMEQGMEVSLPVPVPGADQATKNLPAGWRVLQGNYRVVCLGGQQTSYFCASTEQGDQVGSGTGQDRPQYPSKLVLHMQQLIVSSWAAPARCSQSDKTLTLNPWA